MAADDDQTAPAGGQATARCRSTTYEVDCCLPAGHQGDHANHAAQVTWERGPWEREPAARQADG